MAQETGAAIVVIRHLTKMPGGKAIYRGGGSIGIAGTARSALLVAEDPGDENKRVLARVKSNLAAPVSALRYEVIQDRPDVPRINWLGATEHTATSLLAVPQDADYRSATEECEEWLQDLLEEKGGWMPAKDAQRAGRAAGHSDKVMRSAREKLCGKPSKEGFGGEGQWVWRLRPSQPVSQPKMPTPHKDAQVAHTQNEGALDNTGHLHDPEQETGEWMV